MTILAGCGDDRGPAVSRTVGSQGGTVASDQVLIEIPPGALPADTAVTITPAENPLPNAAGPAFIFGPEGLQFSRPVTITLPFDPAAIPDGEVVSVYTAPVGSTLFTDIGGTAVGTRAVQTMTTHFSVFAAGHRPAKKTPDPILSTVTVDRASGVVADGVDYATVTITVVDAHGVALSGETVQLTATGSGNRFTQSGITNNKGVATATLASTVAEDKTLSATAGGLVIVQMPTVRFVAGPAAKLVFSVPPSMAQAGQNLAPALQITVEDATGNRIAGSTAAVSLSIGQNPSGGVLSGTTTANAVGGIATFSDLSIDKAGVAYTLAASATGLSARSVPFDIVAGAPARLRFVTQPSSTTAGAPIAPLRVAIEDALGNLESGASDAVTVAIGAHAGAGALSGTLTVNAVGGIATFADLSLDKAGQGYTLVASAGGEAGDTSAAFDVTPAAASRLRFTAQPNDANAGTAIAAEVTVEDAFGNLVPTATDAIGIAIANNAGGGSLSGTTTVNATAGVARFAGLSIDKAGVGYTLSASAPGLTPATSSGFGVSAAASARLTFTVQPSNAQAGAPISPVIAVHVEDAFGNQVPAASDAVTIAFANNAGGGTLSGTTVVNAVGGAAAFGDLSIDVAASGYTLSATSGSLSAATSAPFAITVGPPVRLAFLVQPADTVAGALIAPPLQVALEDGLGNIDSTAADLITLAVGTQAGPGALSGTLSVQAVAGIATFSDLSIDKIGNGYTLVANASGGAGGTSAPFAIRAGGPSAGASSVTANPSSVTADGNASASVTVTVLDANGNPVANQAVTIAVSGDGNLLSPSSGLTGTDGRLVATLASTRAEDKTITASVSGFDVHTSVTFIAGAPVMLAFVNQPMDALAGDVLLPVVAIEDTNGNVVTDASNPISLALGSNPWGGTLANGGPLTPSNGVAAFGASVDKVGLGYTLVASASGLTGATSNPFTVSFAAPSRLVFTQQPTSAVSGQILSSVQVAIEDGLGNLVSNATDAITIAIGNNVNSSTLSGTLTVNALGGTASFVDLSLDKAGSGYTLTASDGNLTNATSNAFDITAGAPNQSQSSLVPSPAPLVVGHSTTLTVTIKDANANPVANQSVSFSSTGTGNNFSATSGQTNTSGQLVVTLLSNKAETKTLTAQVGALFGLTAGVTFQPGPPFSQRSFLTANPTNVTADGTSTTTLTALIEDSFSNPVPGQTVTLSSTGGFNVLVQPSTPTDASGRTSGTLSSTRAETKTVTATAGSAAPRATVTFKAGPATLANSSFTASPSSSLLADGLASSTLTLALRDAYGNPVTNHAVSLSASGSSNTFTPASGSTNASGVFTSALASTAVETKTVTAVVAEFNATLSVTFIDAVCDGGGTFQAPFKFTAGGTTYSLTSADLNGDGKLDFAVANVDTNNVSVLLGNGDGTFATAVNYDAGTNPHAVISGDFNHDGKLDLATANSGSNDVSVLLGNGNGTFAAAVSYGAGSGAYSLTTRDFNGDGRLDLAVANRDDGNVSILLGNGNGTFAGAVSYGTDTSPYSVTSGDFNGDGRLDLAVANYAGGNVSVLLGNGNGTFAGAVNHPAGLGASSVTSGDFNADGKLDLAVSNDVSSTASILLGNGNGTFKSAVSYATGASPQFITTSDLNADGKLDLAVATFDTAVSVLFGNGDGSFRAAAGVPNGGEAQLAITSGDFNSDGIVDLAAANGGNNNVTVLLGNGGPGLGKLQPAGTYAAGTNPYSTASGDFNGDGRLDLVVANSNSSTLGVLLGNGNGTFAAAVNYAAISAFGVISADFNGDGKLDLAAPSYVYNNVSILLGNGNGTFAAAVTYPTGTGPTGIASGDFNGDGRLDLALGNQGTNDLSVLIGNGNGTFAAAVNYPVGSDPYSVATGDFNRDGKLDLAVANQVSNNVSVLLGNGDGTFAAAVNYGAGASPLSVTSADFNADGKLDLAAASFGQSGVIVLLGHGDGTFATGVYYAASGYPFSVTSADFNGDGKLDLATANSNGNNVSVLFGKGNGTFSAAVNYAAGTAPWSVTSADFNGDGKPDLAVPNHDGNNLSVFLNGGCYPTGGCGANLLTDSSNCGSCGHVCTSGACVNAVCQCSGSICPPSLLGNLPGALGVAVTPASVFWTNGGSVTEYDRGSGLTTPLYSGSVSGYSSNPIACDGTNVYWADYAGGTVSSLPAGGGSVLQYSSGLSFPYAVAVDASFVYWPNQGSGTLQKAPLGGGLVSTVVSGQSSPTGIASDAQNIYWTNQGDGTVRMISKQSGTSTVLASGQSTPSSVAVDSTYVYWTNYANGTVMKIPIGGSPAMTVATGQSGPVNIASDGINVYWTNYGGGSVAMAPIAGGAATVLATGQATPYGITVDRTGVYWADKGSGAVMMLPR
jgi:hypothetical protein